MSSIRGWFTPGVGTIRPSPGLYTWLIRSPVKAVPVRVQQSQATLAIVFAVWMFVRVFPLAAYPGLYSYDAWTHLGYCLALIQDRRIPVVNYADYAYYVHPAMHILALALYYFLGLPVGVCLQILTVLFPLVLFFAFYVFLRVILKKEWQVQTGMVVLALSPDVLGQTNAALPESLALVFVALGFALILKMIRQQWSLIQKSILLSLVTVCVYLSHHLATLMFALGCIGFCVCLLVLRVRPLWRIGLPATILPAAASLTLLLTFDPFTRGFLEYLLPRYALLPVLVILAAIIVIVLGPRILGGLEHIRGTAPSWVPVVSGVLLAFVLLVLLVSFYPTARPLDWILYKFMPLTILVTLTAAVAPSVLGKKNLRALELALCLFWLGFLCVTFLISAFLAFARVGSWQLLTVEASLAHRHFTYITIAAVPLACTSFAVWLAPYIGRQKQDSRAWRKVIGVSLVALLGCTLVVASGNVYAPAGEWHQNWFSDSELEATFWLARMRGTVSTTVTDGRLVMLFKGVSPFLPSNNAVKPFLLTYISNPTQISGAGNIYYFVTDLMERQFMTDFSTPPSPISIRPYFDTYQVLARIHASAFGAIYLANQALTASTTSIHIGQQSGSQSNPIERQTYSVSEPSRTHFNAYQSCNDECGA